MHLLGKQTVFSGFCRMSHCWANLINWWQFGKTRSDSWKTFSQEKSWKYCQKNVSTQLIIRVFIKMISGSYSWEIWNKSEGSQIFVKDLLQEGYLFYFAKSLIDNKQKRVQTSNFPSYLITSEFFFCNSVTCVNNCSFWQRFLFSFFLEDGRLNGHVNEENLITFFLFFFCPEGSANNGYKCGLQKIPKKPIKDLCKNYIWQDDISDKH